MNNHLCLALQVLFEVGDVLLKGNSGHIHVQLEDIVLLLKLFYQICLAKSEYRGN